MNGRISFCWVGGFVEIFCTKTTYESVTGKECTKRLRVTMTRITRTDHHHEETTLTKS